MQRNYQEKDPAPKPEPMFADQSHAIGATCQPNMQASNAAGIMDPGQQDLNANSEDILRPQQNYAWPIELHNEAKLDSNVASISPSGKNPSQGEEAFTDTKTPDELLHDLALNNDPQNHSTLPSTSTSQVPIGNVISVTFCLPFKISHEADGVWVRVEHVISRSVSQLMRL